MIHIYKASGIYKKRMNGDLGKRQEQKTSIMMVCGKHKKDNCVVHSHYQKGA